MTSSCGGRTCFSRKPCCDTHWHNFWKKNTFDGGNGQSLGANTVISFSLYLCVLMAIERDLDNFFLHVMGTAWQPHLSDKSQCMGRVHCAQHGQESQALCSAQLCLLGMACLALPFLFSQENKFYNEANNKKTLLAVYEGKYHSLIYCAGRLFMNADRAVISVIHFIIFFLVFFIFSPIFYVEFHHVSLLEFQLWNGCLFCFRLGKVVHKVMKLLELCIVSF